MAPKFGPGDMTPGGSTLVFGGPGQFPVFELPGGRQFQVTPEARALAQSLCERGSIPADICALGIDLAVAWINEQGGADQVTQQQQQTTTDCGTGFVLDGQGRCVPITQTNGGGNGGMNGDLTPDTFTPAEAGNLVRGRFGIGQAPRVAGRLNNKRGQPYQVLRCPKGMILGKDNVCYESLRNHERKWPKGRKPLLTGGEMNAITKAARAASRLQRTKKRLKKASRMIERAC